MSGLGEVRQLSEESEGGEGEYRRNYLEKVNV